MTNQYVLTDEEQIKFNIVTATIKKKIKTGRAARILGVTPRQIQRLKKLVKRFGQQAVVHKLKGKISNHHIDISVKENALNQIKTQYPDFKPKFAAEKLKECHNIEISPQTTRRWMARVGLWKIRKQKQVQYRSWRPRKEYYGELEQFDGSYHLWFEDRYKDNEGHSIEVCLLLSVDDATGKITYGEFTSNEGVKAVFNFWRTYTAINGKPLNIYLDKFSTYKINHKSAIDNKDLITQFERAMNSLSICLIIAHSPQAKGRIERLFGTLQDRLVKEMRLANINNPQDGNHFLKEIFIPKFNKQFSVIAQREGDVHRELTDNDKQNLNRIFSTQSKRKTNNDFTIQFKNNWYQLKEIQPTTVRPKETVTVEEWLDNTLHFNLRSHDLNYLKLPNKPIKMKSNPVILTTHHLNWKPPANHPWRKYRNRY